MVLGLCRFCEFMLIQVQKRRVQGLGNKGLGFGVIGFP